MASENHVENPFEFALEKMGWAAADISKVIVPDLRRHDGQAAPVVQKISVADLREALRQGVADVAALRDDILFIGLIYPLAGLLLAAVFANADLLPMVFPLASGFALLGPVAAIGLYELSRRRERGDHVTWLDAFGVLKSPALPSIIGLGAILLALFFVWLGVAWQIYLATLGAGAGAAPQSLMGFEQSVFTTAGGWSMIAAGFGVGFLFAAVAFVISAVSFPLLLDRDVTVRAAVGASFRVVRENFGVMVIWGLIVAFALALGSLPGLVGLIFVVPMLGHATWHLYRKLIA